MGAPVMNEVTFTDYELDTHVRNALNVVIEGDHDYYNQLVSLLHHKEHLVAEEVSLLVTCLKAVAGAVRCIHISHHQSLLAAILGMSLWNYSTDVMDAIVELLGCLAASSGEYVDLCLEMLVINFIPPAGSGSHFVDLLKKPSGIAKKNQVLDCVHSALSNITKMYPVHSPRRLGKIIIERMPKLKMKEHVFIEIYIENMLRLEGGKSGELVSCSLLSAIIDSLRDLDVEIDWEDILRDDFHKNLFDSELENFELQLDDIQQDGNEFYWEAVVQRFSGNVIARKLDDLMVLVFKYLQSCNDSGLMDRVFETLLQSFQTTILTAYKSKFSQFIIFYACSLNPEYCGKKFSSMLVDIFISSPIPQRRMSAVSYLASFLARAKFLDVSFISTVMERVVNWCFVYCEGQAGGIDPKAHKVFYAGCQSIMYVLCFRMRQMLSIPRHKSQLLNMHIEDILGHSLKPLQVCLPSIVEEFLRLTKANNIFPLPQIFVEHGLLESEHSRSFGGIERLDTFFPFDPCLLMKSDRFIRPNYVYWSMVRSTYDDEGTSDEEDVNAREYGNGMNIPVSGNSLEDNFDVDAFDKMSITPVNKVGSRFMQMPSKIRPSTSPESL